MEVKGRRHLSDEPKLAFVLLHFQNMRAGCQCTIWYTSKLIFFTSNDTDCYQDLIRAISLCVTRNEPARLLFFAQCVEALRERFTSHFKQQYYSFITPDATKHTANKRPHIYESEGLEKKKGEERAWWLLSGSQERFSPSIGVLKAPWIINGLSLRSLPPLPSSFSSCHCAPFPPITPQPASLIASISPPLPPLAVFFFSHCLPFCLQVNFYLFPPLPLLHSYSLPASSVHLFLTYSPLFNPYFHLIVIPSHLGSFQPLCIFLFSIPASI